jgi:hypothetical protein
VRWAISLGLALALSASACEQTVYLGYDGSIGTGGAASLDGGDGGPPLSCTGSMDLTPESPEVIFAVDRSTGMMTAKLSDTTAFVAARDAVYQNAELYQNVVSFGYVEFPAASYVFDSCTSNQQSQSCCASPVSPPNMNFTVFDDAYHACDPPYPQQQYCSMGSSQRPSVPALSGCYMSFAQRNNRAKRFVMLVTNGQPDCGINSNSGCMDASMVAGQLYTNLKARVHLFVPGQLDGATTDCLGTIAQSGGATSPPYYHPASSSADLIQDIGSVTRASAMEACHLDLPSSARPLSGPDGLVLVWKDMQIPYDRTGNDGWNLPGSGNGFTIDLHGSACSNWIEDGQGTFTLRTGCDTRH